MKNPSGHRCVVCRKPVNKRRRHTYSTDWGSGKRKAYGCMACSDSGAYDKWLDAQPRLKSELNPSRAKFDVDKLDKFTRQYIETALWSENEEDGTPLDKNYNIHDIAEATLKGMIADAKKFQEENWDDISSDPSRAGHDFWLTRNGHGAGFWDGDWPKAVGDRLTKAAKKFGEAHLYVGDDSAIYAM